MPWSSIAESNGDSAVAVLRQGFGHARRGATTGAGLDVQTTAELVQREVRGDSKVQFMDTIMFMRTARGDATGAVL